MKETGFLYNDVGPLKIWQWIAIVALLFFLDRQGIVNVPLIGGQKGGRITKKIRKRN
tara:strand:- start:456 stop:626 length:171 start_codon:yes stop_codon:yes gene_type:complete